MRSDSEKHDRADLIFMYRKLGVTFAEIGSEFRISAKYAETIYKTRAYQIEREAMCRMKDRMIDGNLKVPRNELEL